MKFKKLLFLGCGMGIMLSCGNDDASVLVTEPENNLPKVDEQTLSMATNAEVSDTDLIGTLKATDADNDALTFTIISNSNSELFTVQTTADGGEIRLAKGKTFDFEGDTKTYEITVGIKDDGDQTISVQVTIAVSKTNVPPEIGEQTLEVSELWDGNEGIEISASDVDGDSLEFSIAEDEDELFQISATGALRLKKGKSLDFETKKEYVITVMVDDNTATASAKITLTVINENDEAPEIKADQEFTPEKSILANETFGTVTAMDADGDTDFTFSIEEGNTDLFAIDAESGDLILVEGASLDFEVEQIQYVLTIKVSDQVNESTGQITITVVNKVNSLFEDPDAFITEWNIPENGFELVLPINLSFLKEYNFVIDWGDESDEQTVSDLENADQVPRHVYPEAGGTFRVAIKGNFPAFRADYFGEDNGVTQPMRNTLVDVVQWGAIKWESLVSAFNGCYNLGGFSATDVPDLTEGPSMSAMFRNATTFNGDISKWDMSNVTDMGLMFRNAIAFNRDISEWDVSKVVDFLSTFLGATAFDQDLGDWEIPNVESMFSMFNGSGMSPENYSNTLVGWSAYAETPDDINLTAGGVTYLCSAVVAKTILENKGWIIDDGGLAPGELCL
ncbi:MAG: BspA family leucine-rich repeat surface protein [Bacteroidota bacterium]